MVSVERRRWSGLHHLEMKVVLGELDRVNLPVAASFAGALRGGVLMHDKPPHHVLYRESWPLEGLDAKDVVDTARGLGMIAGLYRNSMT